MTQERFAQIVEDPELLRRITYEELKTLALAYPYAHNLRCLLAIKARQIDHAEATRNLATAAAYSLDRTKLFLLIAPQIVAPQQILTPDEILELKPIETVKRELEALAPVTRVEKTIEFPKATEANIEPAAVAATEFREAFEIIYQPREVIEIIPEPPAPINKETFSDWLNRFQPPVLDAPLPKTSKPTTIVEKIEETAKTVGIAQQLAERSVSENQDVISETLAKLYAKQGYRDKSAQMYARLALLFPEKSAYFAAEIDKLKK